MTNITEHAQPETETPIYEYYICEECSNPYLAKENELRCPECWEEIKEAWQEGVDY